MKPRNKLRHILSRMKIEEISIGEVVQFVDVSPSPENRVVKTLTKGSYYRVTDINGEAIEVINDNDNKCFYYADRFIKRPQNDKPIVHHNLPSLPPNMEFSMDPLEGGTGYEIW